MKYQSLSFQKKGPQFSAFPCPFLGVKELYSFIQTVSCSSIMNLRVVILFVSDKLQLNYKEKKRRILNGRTAPIMRCQLFKYKQLEMTPPSSSALFV